MDYYQFPLMYSAMFQVYEKYTLKKASLTLSALGHYK